MGRKHRLGQQRKRWAIFPQRLWTTEHGPLMPAGWVWWRQVTETYTMYEGWVAFTRDNY